MAVFFRPYFHALNLIALKRRVRSTFLYSVLDSTKHMMFNLLNASPNTPEPTMTKTEALSKALTRYTNGGGNEEAGRAILAEICRQPTAALIALDLAHMGFATTRTAPQMAEALI